MHIPRIMDEAAGKRVWRTQEFGKELGMPVVLSNITERRDPYFREIYSELLSSLRSNGILRGAATTAHMFSGQLRKCYCWHLACRRPGLCAISRSAPGPVALEAGFWQVDWGDECDAEVFRRAFLGMGGGHTAEARRADGARERCHLHQHTVSSVRGRMLSTQDRHTAAAGTLSCECAHVRDVLTAPASNVHLHQHHTSSACGGK